VEEKRLLATAAACERLDVTSFIMRNLLVVMPLTASKADHELEIRAALRAYRQGGKRSLERGAHPHARCALSDGHRLLSRAAVRYATVTRYPGSENITLREARRAVAAPRRIRRAVRAVLPAGLQRRKSAKRPRRRS